MRGPGRAVSRILSAPTESRERIIYLRGIYPGSFRPAGAGRSGAGRSGIPYLALHPTGFSVPPGLLTGRWALTPPFHPYPPPAPEGFSGEQRAVCFLWHCPSAQPHGWTARVYADIHLAGARLLPDYAASRPWVFGLSSPPAGAGGATLRPSRTGLTLPATGGGVNWNLAGGLTRV